MCPDSLFFVRIGKGIDDWKVCLIKAQTQAAAVEIALEKNPGYFWTYVSEGMEVPDQYYI